MGKKSAKPTRGKGRPPAEVSDEQIQGLTPLAAYGMTVEEMATVLGISKKTLERLSNRDERIKDAIEKGRLLAGSKLKRKAYEMAEKGDRTMLIFLLKVRYGWSETQKHLHDINPGSILEEFLDMDPAQRRALIKEKNRKLGLA
jgi:DNA-binding XRE family transcriptional regulator